MAPTRSNRHSNYSRPSSLLSSSGSLRFASYAAYSATSTILPQATNVTPMKDALSGFLAAPGPAANDALKRVADWPALAGFLIVSRHLESAHRIAHGGTRPAYTIEGVTELTNRLRAIMVELEYLQDVIVRTLVTSQVAPTYLTGENIPPPPGTSSSVNPPRIPSPRPPTPMPGSYADIRPAFPFDLASPIAAPYSVQASAVFAGPSLLRWEQQMQSTELSTLPATPSELAHPTDITQTPITPGASPAQSVDTLPLSDVPVDDPGYLADGEHSPNPPSYEDTAAAEDYSQFFEAINWSGDPFGPIYEESQ